MIESKLQFLGLLPEETKIYLTLLKYGTSSVAVISRITDIGRVNCYHYIDKLLAKGLITQSQKSKIKQFTAENPRIFINKSQEKLNIATDLIPELLAISSSSGEKPKIQIFEGWDGVKNIFHKMVEVESREIVSFSNFDKLSELLPEFLPEHFAKRLEKEIKTRFISPWTKEAEKFRGKFFPSEMDTKLLEIFLISQNEFFFDSEISVFGGVVAIINLNRKNPVGVIIENPEIFRTQKAIFDLAWLGATSFISQ
jgi:sugar-specific transcriptional regulator TrmB